MKNKSSFENVRLSLVVQFATNKLFVCSFRKVLAIRNHKRLFGDKHILYITNYAQINTVQFTSVLVMIMITDVVIKLVIIDEDDDDDD